VTKTNSGRKFPEQLRETRKQFGNSAPRGQRLTTFAEAGMVEDVPMEAMIEREPITVICSKMGWIRAMKGHQALDSEFKFKDGDEARFAFHAETTDKLIVAWVEWSLLHCPRREPTLVAAVWANLFA
jgi:topoisomerase-4 subunit A